MSNFAFLSPEFPGVHEAAAEAERQAGVSIKAMSFFKMSLTSRLSETPRALARSER
jgi:hypothetical protein